MVKKDMVNMKLPKIFCRLFGHKRPKPTTLVEIFVESTCMRCDKTIPSEWTIDTIVIPKGVYVELLKAGEEHPVFDMVAKMLKENKKQ